MEPLDVLREDHQQTLAFIDKCDQHMFTIKNWAVVTSSAVIAFSISQDQDAIVLTNVPILLAFIYLELIYKSFQDTAIDHTADLSQRIDKYLAAPSSPDLLSGYSHGFGRKLGYPSLSRLLSIIRKRTRRHILSFYGLLALFSISAFVVARFVA